MSYQMVYFDDHEPYVSSRPRTTIELHGPGGRHQKHFIVTGVLVDTGATYMLLPEEAAVRVGITKRGAQYKRIITAGGVVQVWRKVVSVTILGRNVRVPVSFRPQSKPLLGWQAIFAVVQTAGFGPAEWLQEWRAAGGSASMP